MILSTRNWLNCKKKVVIQLNGYRWEKQRGFEICDKIHFWSITCYYSLKKKKKHYEDWWIMDCDIGELIKNATEVWAKASAKIQSSSILKNIPQHKAALVFMKSSECQKWSLWIIIIAYPVSFSVSSKALFHCQASFIAPKKVESPSREIFAWVRGIRSSSLSPESNFTTPAHHMLSYIIYLSIHALHSMRHLHHFNSST